MVEEEVVGALLEDVDGAAVVVVVEVTFGVWEVEARLLVGSAAELVMVGTCVVLLVSCEDEGCVVVPLVLVDC